MRSYEELAWPRDSLLRINFKLEPVGQPTRRPCDGEHYGEHLRRQSDRLVYKTGVEVNIWVESSADEILVSKGHAL